MRHLFLISIALLAACADSAPRNQDTNAAEAPVDAPVAERSASEDRPPIAENPDTSAQAAAAVLRRYFALAGAGRWEDADALWWDEGRAEDFAARLRRLGAFEPSIAAPGRIEGAAGSAYVSVSLQLLRDSRSLSDGTAVLRRVNNVPGSTAEQRRWRIDRITLQPPPVSRPAGYRFIGRWASSEANCSNRAWRFTAESLTTPAGSVCTFERVNQVPGGYDIVATCTAEGPPTDDRLELRFAESARALLFESDVIADAGLVGCP